jgi:RAB protein geranylgeranyltransferase component A
MITSGEKRDLIDWITNLENQSLLKHLMELKAANESNETVFQVSEQEREGINIGLDDWENGRTKTHKEMKDELKLKFPHLFK